MTKDGKKAVVVWLGTDPFHAEKCWPAAAKRLGYDVITEKDVRQGISLMTAEHLQVPRRNYEDHGIDTPYNHCRQCGCFLWDAPGPSLLERWSKLFLKAHEIAQKVGMSIGKYYTARNGWISGRTWTDAEAIEAVCQDEYISALCDWLFIINGEDIPTLEKPVKDARITPDIIEWQDRANQYLADIGRW
ncbi:MAG: hypothetical protein SWH78_04260 [Thermodesulfobacteriota bacterium]|nr:hypothetical protein [Thermodesulfobacteriota bacterium]